MYKEKMRLSSAKSSKPGSKSADTAVRRVVAEILDGLRQGRYRPGQRLVIAELAEELGLSAIPVREGLHILSGQEIVELRPQRGARIRELTSKEILDTLRVWPTIAKLNWKLAAERLSEGCAAKKYEREIAALHVIRRKIQEAYERRVSLDLFNAIQTMYDVSATINDNGYFSSLRGPLHIELYYRQVADVLPGPLWDRYVANILGVLERVLSGDSIGMEKLFERHHRLVLEYLTTELSAREVRP